MPEGGQEYDYYPNMSNGKLEPWTKRITGFHILKNVASTLAMAVLQHPIAILQGGYGSLPPDREYVTQL